MIGYVNTLDERSPQGVLWTRINSAESLPGVLSPATWSFYGGMLERSLRAGFADLGIIPRTAAVRPEAQAERMLGIFHGRIAINVNATRRVMAGFPGVDGDQIERDLLGATRLDVHDNTYRFRLPVILAKAPWRLIAGAREPAHNHAATHAWWCARVTRNGPRTGVDPRELLCEALEGFGRAVRLQGQTRMVFQASASQLTALAVRAGEPEAASTLLAGSANTEESRTADDLHLLAHDQLDLETFLARHGFHGPNSGELFSRSWRENPEPLVRSLARVASAEPPNERRARAAVARAHVVERVLGSLPPAQRAVGRVVLRLGPVAARSLEHTKTAFLITGDAGRAAIRAIGTELANAGRIDDPDDAFHLFAQELLARETTGDLRDRISERKALREKYLAVTIPETWEGQPQPQPKRQAERDAETKTLTGIGGSPGVAEGLVRVIRDADDNVDVEHGEIVVCPTTDPSWVPVMAVASALVIDIGAAGSHGAIVARELGVPCVIGTRTGTTDLRDGDRIRVDGSTGRVTILNRGSAR